MQANPNLLIQLRRPLAVLLLLGAALTMMLAVPSSAWAQAADAAAAGTPPAVEKSLLDLFNQGGIFMYPLLLCSMGTMAVAVYCFVAVSKSKLLPKGQVESLTHYMTARDPGNAYQLCRSNPNSFTNTVSAALLKVNFERDLANKHSMEAAAAETLMLEENKYMQWINYLNVFATIAPMIGLLGTVAGMIASFDQLAAGRSEPSDLAGGIGEAMITTAGGLIVGIPAMFFYFFFRNRLTGIMGDIQKTVTFLVDVISGELKLEEAVQHAADEAAETHPEHA